MSDTFYKFPSTPHLCYLGAGSAREDKVLTPHAAAEFLSGPVVAEEKVDGANLGISFDASGQVRLQNRGNWLSGRVTGQWRGLRWWTERHYNRLSQCLPERHVLFGEWCFAKHSVAYNNLPDWFLAFDVFDSTSERFWSSTRRNALLQIAGISGVPEIGRGLFSLPQLREMVFRRSALGDSAREGVYVRREDEEWLLSRVKLVNPQFIQTIEEHWSRRSIEANSLGLRNA